MSAADYIHCMGCERIRDEADMARARGENVDGAALSALTPGYKAIYVGDGGEPRPGVGDYVFLCEKHAKHVDTVVGDLLKALEFIVEAVDGDEPCDFSEAIKLARAAIAKAKGGKP